jgi:hypothetical protein
MQRILLNDDGGQVLQTILAHSSGQWVESRMRLIPPKNDVQSMGSYITYLRRYMYSAIVGVVAADEDDDGERTMERHRLELSKTNLNSYRAKNQPIEYITREHLQDLEYELQDEPALAEEVMDKLQIQSLSEMPESIYHASIERIRQIKVARTASSNKSKPSN